MAVDAFFMLANYPIPSQEEMCRTVREFRVLAEEGLEFEADTPAESARAYYERVGTAYREGYDTLVLIGDITPTYAALGPLQKSIDKVGGRATVGPVFGEIRARVRELVNALRPLVMEATNISKAFDGRSVVSDLSTRVMRGDRIGIVGPNGAGRRRCCKCSPGNLHPTGARSALGQVSTSRCSISAATSWSRTSP